MHLIRKLYSKYVNQFMHLYARYMQIYGKYAKNTKKCIMIPQVADEEYTNEALITGCVL